MKLPDSMPTPEADERTPEITGHDASMDEAAIGDAGNGADPYGGDLTGGPPRELEEEPRAADIAPDTIDRFPGAPEDEEEEELTARPNEAPPIDPSEFP